MRGGLRMQMPGDIQPVVDIDNVEIGDRWSLAERIFQVGATQPAIAAQNGVIALNNPLGSGVIVEIENVSLACGSSTGIDIIERHDGTLVGSTTAVVDADSRSDRWALSVASPISLENGAQVGAPGGVGGVTYSFFVATGPVVMEHKLVLTPGHRVSFFGGSVNVAIGVVFSGRYRQILPGEI